MNLRVRSKTGVTNLRGVDKNLTLQDFKVQIEKEIGIPAPSQKFLAGFPPKEIIRQNSELIGTIFANGDVITVELDSSAGQNQSNVTVPPPAAIVTHPPPPVTQPQIPAQPQSPAQPSTGNQMPGHQSSAPPQHDPAPGFVGVSDGSVIRRVIPDDNSCLFHAISYVLENKANDKVSQLRNIIAKEIANDPISYNEGILGKTPRDYQNWIKQNNSWGGSVELNIFAKHYKTEIMAYDITRNRGNLFAEEQGFTSRVYLIYDGIHYDCLVWNIVPSDPSPDFDVTIFNSKDVAMEKEFEKFMEKEHKSGKFVDEYNYTLKCEQCGKLFKGNNEATAHAKSTGHTRFGQASN